MLEIAAVLRPLEERVAEIDSGDSNLDSVLIDADFVKNGWRGWRKRSKEAKLPQEELALLVRTVVDPVEIDAAQPTKLFLAGQLGPVEDFEEFSRKEASPNPSTERLSRTHFAAGGSAAALHGMI